jgi:hypothetical protein
MVSCQRYRPNPSGSGGTFRMSNEDVVLAQTIHCYRGNIPREDDCVLNLVTLESMSITKDDHNENGVIDRIF